MQVVNTDTASYLQQFSEKTLAVVEWEKKCKYLESCLQHRCHFYPFIVSVKIMMGTNVEETMNRLAIRLATKWRQLYSCTCSYVRSMVTITMARANQHCIRGSRVMASWISVHQPQWKGGA